jgi:O-antigen/teichoic acid export membrane protein
VGHSDSRSLTGNFFVRNSFKQRFVSGAIWSGLGRVVATVGGFVTTLILAKALSPSEIGAYFVAFNSIIIFSSLGSLGMDEIVVRFASTATVAGEPRAPSQVLRRCLAISVVGAAVATVLFFEAAPYFFGRTLRIPQLLGLLGFIAAWLFFATLQRQLAESFRGLDDIRSATLFGGVRSNGIVNAALGCLVIGGLWSLGLLTLSSAVGAMLGSSAFVVMIALYKLHRDAMGRSLANAQTPTSRLGTRQAIYEAWPLWLATLINVFNAMGGVWLASAFDTAEHVALFGVAQRFVLLIITPMLIVNLVLPPIIARMHASGELRRIEHIVRTVSGLSLLPALAVLVLLVIAGEPVIRSIFGVYYLASYPLLLIFCAGQVINIATGAWQIVMPMTGSRLQMLATSIIAIGVQGGAGIYLGSRFGVLGVAIGFAISLAVSNLFGMIAVRLSLGIWTFAKVDRDSLGDVFAMLLARMRGRFPVRSA